MEFPKHETMYITHNEHKSSYQAVFTYLDELGALDEIDGEDLKVCIGKDDLWCVQVYPHTPISSHRVYSYSLERCLELLKERGVK